MPEDLIETYHAEAAENWNKFYAKNENKFFKDRHWIRIEFPELFQMIEADVRIPTTGKLDLGMVGASTFFFRFTKLIEHAFFDRWTTTLGRKEDSHGDWMWGRQHHVPTVD